MPNTASDNSAAKRCLKITEIEQRTENGQIVVEFHLDNGEKQEILWYRVDSDCQPLLCLDRCDTPVMALVLAAMKAGYETIESDYPISEKLYYNLQYHVIPQLFVAGGRKIARTQIKAPITKTVFHGDIVATGMSRGVDSFASMYEYYNSMPLDEYRVNAFTYFQAGAHHGFDRSLGRGEESKQELFEHQMGKTKEMCRKYGYPLIVVESNINDILIRSGLFVEKFFDRTHTFRNLSIAALLQKGIRRYYYSSTYTLNDFKLTLNADMAYYERWLIPHLSTGSIEYYQSNQDWRRIDKVEKLTHMEECQAYLQVCLIKSGNCGKCMKCRRTLMELDALGEDALNKFAGSFDIETYKREDRRRWFSSIIEDKEKENSEAHYFEESFLCAAENHPELLDYIDWEMADGIQYVTLRGNGTNIRELPSLHAEVVFVGKRGDSFRYLGENGPWVKLETLEGKTAYIHKPLVILSPKK